MNGKVAYFVADKTNPYRNQAIEEALLTSRGDTDTLLYLWQNRRTVVVGRNQNIFDECRVAGLVSDGGFAARRLSGGGAVYHDEGNLNFSFIVPSAVADTARQLRVISRAVERFGIKTSFSGRNDLLANGCKFSGNAFYKKGNRVLHHGTLMISVDTESLESYLTPNAEKLASKGVSSVRSRVTNLAALCPSLTTDALIPALVAAFGDEYGTPDALVLTENEAASVACLEEKFASPAWVYGTSSVLRTFCRGRFAWGGAEVRIMPDPTCEHIAEAEIYSDSLEWRIVPLIAESLRGAALSCDGIAEAFSRINAFLTDSETEIVRDILSMLTERLAANSKE